MANFLNACLFPLITLPNKRFTITFKQGIIKITLYSKIINAGYDVINWNQVESKLLWYDVLVVFLHITFLVYLKHHKKFRDFHFALMSFRNLLMNIICAAEQTYFVEIIFKPPSSIGRIKVLFDMRCFLLLHKNETTFWQEL